MNGLDCLLVEDELVDFMPLYYLVGHGAIFSENEYFKLRKNARSLNKYAYKNAERWTKKLGQSDSIFHHTPFLL